MTASTETVHLVQRQDHQFDVRFGEALPVLQADEPPPLGRGRGPTPVQLLAAAVGNCLSDSLLFALRKFRQAPEPIRAEVRAEVGRNAEGRLRVLALHAELRLGVRRHRSSTWTGCWPASRLTAPSRRAWPAPSRCTPACSTPTASR
jgi:uncharacterized OsmC-like protein